MEKLLGALIDGVAFGCVYALLAVGLTLAYKTSGVFNIAFGVQAFASGAIYYQLHVNDGWGILPAFIISVIIVAPLIGAILDRFLFRHLRSAPSMARLITALGLLVAIPQIVLLKFNQTEATRPTGIVPGGDVPYHIFGATLSRDQLSIMVCAVIVAVGLVLVFRYTALGIRMRAVVESPRMAELAGTDADRIGTAAWMLSSLVAGLAGVLLPTVTSQVGDIYYTTLLTAAIAATVLGSLTSIPLAFFGAIGLGVVQELLNRYLPTNSVLASNLRPSLPFVVLFLVLILSPRLRNKRELTDPLSSVDPPPPAPAAGQRSRELTIGTRVAGVLFGLGIGYYVFFHGNASVVGQGIQVVIYSIIFCSIVVITGIAGEVSFAQATFAGIGGFASAQLSSSAGMSVIFTIIIGGLIAAAVGAMLAIPALRLGGIFLTLATYAFALFFDNVIVSLSWVSGGLFPVVAPRPQLGSIDFASDRSFLVLCLVFLVIVGVIVMQVRSGTTGRYLSAVRGSEVAAASVGISPTRARITAFALSAGIAGVGGALLASYEGHANKIDYNATLGLFWVVIVVTLGSRTVEGAIQAALGFVLFSARVLPDWIPWIINHVQPFLHVDSLPNAVQFIFFGFGALTYAKHQEGILEANKVKSLAWVQGKIDRFKSGGRTKPGAAAVDTPGAAP
ncbi:MAG: inner-rane translocator [Actinomycetia bacterium]|nr:inner-rane translocator [Actinomycetes bacterium]